MSPLIFLFFSGDGLGTDSVKHVARLLLRFSSRVLLSCAFFVFFIYFFGACMRTPPLVPLPRGFLGRSCADPSCLALHRAPLSFSDLGSCLSSATFTLFSFFVSCSHFVTFRDSSHRRFRFLFCSIGRPGVPVVPRRPCCECREAQCLQSTESLIWLKLP